jgi:DNA-binding NtrC family response regulator
MKTKFGKKIFVVDDDPFVTAYLAQILNNIGYYNVSHYGSGKECLNHIHHNPEIIFLDYQMDDMDGIQVLKEVKDYFPGINVIFTTALEDLAIAVQSISNGSFDFLLKKNINENEVNSIMLRVAEEQQDIHSFI